MPINSDRMRRMQELGLTEYQARVYLTLLDLGAASASQIPALSRVPRTRVYATMNQLHEKGLVEIVPETPLRYRPVPVSKFLQARAGELKDKAKEIELHLEELSREFAVKGGTEPEARGRFEALYGRKNVRERLQKMYSSAEREIIGIGTMRSPQRIVKSAIYTIEERYRGGVDIRYAFPVTSQNRGEVERIAKVAHVRNISVQLPMYFYVFDSREVLLNHPIPDDENFHRGDDIAVWTDDPGIAKAMQLIAEKIWASGTEPGTPDVMEPVWEIGRQYLQLLGPDAAAALVDLGPLVGRTLAKSMGGTTPTEVLADLARYYQEHDLARVEVVSTSPLVVQVENFVDCAQMHPLGKSLCQFIEGVVTTVMEEKLGYRVRVTDNRCFGPCNNRCRLSFALEVPEGLEEVAPTLASSPSTP